MNGNDNDRTRPEITGLYSLNGPVYVFLGYSGVCMFFLGYSGVFMFFWVFSGVCNL